MANYGRNMKAYLLQAPRDFVEAGIPKGYMLQVISDRTSGPDFTEVREALKRAEFRPVIRIL